MNGSGGVWIGSCRCFSPEAADEGAVVVEEGGGTEPAQMVVTILRDVGTQTEGNGGVTHIVIELWHNALNGAIVSSAVTSVDYISAGTVLGASEEAQMAHVGHRNP